MIPPSKQVGAVVKTSRNRSERFAVDVRDGSRQRDRQAAPAEEEVMEERTRTLPHQCTSPQHLIHKLELQRRHVVLHHLRWVFNN